MTNEGAAFDPAAGQRGLEQHFRDWFELINRDFRATSLSRLVCGLMPPGRVLDIGCGSGALSVELVSAGYDVTAQEPSDEMLGASAASIFGDETSIRPGYGRAGSRRSRNGVNSMGSQRWT